MRRLALSIAVALLISLAGCGGALNAGQGPPEGLSTQGIEDGYQVASTHQAALQDQPFRIEIHQEIVDAENGTTYYEREATATWAADHSRFRFDITVTGNPPGYQPVDGSVSYYSNGSIAVQKRVVGGGEPDVRVVTGQTSEPVPVSEVAGRWMFGSPSVTQFIGPRFQAAGSDSVTRTERGFRVEAEELDTESVSVGRLPIGNISGGSLTAFVTPRGDVRNLEFEADGKLSGTEVEVRETMTVSETGTASVEEPAWFERAIGDSGSEE